MSPPGPVEVIGGGLAGCEVALLLAAAGIPVRLLEMKPRRRSAAHRSDQLGELVCSNSLRSASLNNAVGLLKWELREVGSRVMAAADAHAVPAGDALAVDREGFAAWLTAAITAEPLIERVLAEVEALPPPDRLAVICTGPLTAPRLAEALAERAGREHLYFYDAVAPIVDGESLDWDVVWRQSRWGAPGEGDYLNVPLDEATYHRFVLGLRQAEKVEAHTGIEHSRYFEGCLPIEVMAERGLRTLAHGPMKPVGLSDPRTGRPPYAVAQLRMESRRGTAWNMVGFQTRLKRPEQQRLFRSLPGLERLELLRFGSVHRNTYLHTPSLLAAGLHWHDQPNLYLAGQITGVEGYVESAACGLMVGWHVLARLRGVALPPPPGTTSFGALRRHILGTDLLTRYSPSNLNWSLFDTIERRRREPRRERRARMSARAQADLLAWWREARLTLGV